MEEIVARTPSTPATAQKWLTCNGRQLRKLARAGLDTLEQNHQAINDLNVFPVPDGDTGTNMLLTMRAAFKRIQASEETHVGKVAHEISHGALMGARGNSGVILSQIWRGLAKGLKDKPSFDSGDLAAALTVASDTAYQGVMRPVEGTILTVIREAAEEAEDAVGKSEDLRFLLARVVERSQQALARTPDMLPVLKQAGVVDAGGQGLVTILEGMLRSVHGEAIDTVDQLYADRVPAQARVAPAEGLEFPYDVQFILTGEGLDVSAVRTAIDAMGDSTLVVGDESTVKVHVHTKDPGLPISHCIGLGTIGDVVVENMQLQMEKIVEAAPTLSAEAVKPIDSARSTLQMQPRRIGVVAVAAGDGLADIFLSLGAAAIVDGGQSNNPSTEEIFQAVQDVPSDQVVILPNNKNIILAAKAARDLSAKHVEVVPTHSAPQGISALLALNDDSQLEEAVEAMLSATENVTSAEIAVATRSAFLHGVTVAEGEIIGVVNGHLCAASDDISAVLRQVMEEMDMEDRELVSVYYGREVTEADAEALVTEIEELYPDVEVELLSGGQSVYQYILGAE